MIVQQPYYKCAIIWETQVNDHCYRRVDIIFWGFGIMYWGITSMGCIFTMR